jgi:hypothetical protein
LTSFTNLNHLLNATRLQIAYTFFLTNNIRTCAYPSQLAALILQHFERGAKLNDSSNRYAHTCKACGEKFPKGRIDSLTNHLVKKCPGITLQQRQKALLELNGFSGDGPKNAHGESKTNGPSVELPIGTRNWTALETLAEASRQIATNEKPDPNQPLSGIDPERPDQLELREQYTLENPPLSYEQHVQRGKKSKLRTLPF